MEKNSLCVNIIGAGLAGCEAAYYLASKNIKVKLYEMKKIKKTPAQKMDTFAELVCSNSLKNIDKHSASGLLKYELNSLDCFLLKCANKSAVPSGNSLSVNRDVFSNLVTNAIYSNKNIEVIDKVVENIDVNIPTIIATGPLCDDTLFKNLSKLIGQDNCYFYDAIAPIVSLESIDLKRAFWGNRYEKGETKDYLNCWLNKQEFDDFYNALISAEIVKLHEFEKLKVFEGCMPIEIMAKRGEKVLRYGPMKPVGLCKQVKEEKPYAIVQLRKENNEGTFLNMVGFQTNLIFKEQKRVFSMIPALKNAEFVRYGTMHRNSFINAPKSLNEFSQLKLYPNIFIAGQISGVEGYMESIASGLYSAINMYRYITGKKLKGLSPKTCIGGMINYITTADEDNFQPMNANYGIIACYETFDNKQDKREYIFNTSLKEIENFKED